MTANTAELDGGAVHLDGVNSFMICADKEAAMVQVARKIYDTSMAFNIWSQQGTQFNADFKPYRALSNCTFTENVAT